ncbi:histidine phosphatase superfamily [Scheffersomyces coipomensis]|uniref:histidine phosphatase superfamily n=1 Tax=Scheffersomyces coipomensis TaxID=1788519 RepID=UPI00315C50A6
MVSISAFINSGLLLVGQSVFRGLASPQQAATEQYNLIKFLGGSAPYIQSPGFGISTDFPETCTIEQVQLLSRHGERYPTVNKGEAFEKIITKLGNTTETYSGSLAFLNSYEYFVTDKSQYALETTPENSEGTYAGSINMSKHGAYFRNRYKSLFDDTQVLSVFTTNSNRVYHSSESFARGFLGNNYSEANVKYSILDESGSLGINSLTPRYGCTSYDKSANSELLKQIDRSYLTNILDRLKEDNPFLTIDEEDVLNLFEFCAYEINVKSESPFCNIFNTEDFNYYAYDNDLDKYYSSGPGNNISEVIGSVYLNASLNLLKDEENSNKIWLSFTHDTDIDQVISALGFFTKDEHLPLDRVDLERVYYHAYLVPQGARYYTEKLKCGEKFYVRYIINDSVHPIPECQSGPGFSCEFSEYENFINSRIGNINFVEQCQVPADATQSLTFFWDYESKNYTAELEL